MSFFKIRNIHIHIHTYTHVYTCTSPTAKERNSKLLQSKHVPHNPKQDVMFMVEHNVGKKIRWETSKKPNPLSMLWFSGGCKPSLLVLVPTADSEKGGMALMGVVMLRPSEVLTIHNLAGCPMQSVIPYLLTLFRLA